MHEPEVLILDEPTSGLDPNQIAEIRSVIKQIGQEKTVIFSTHILGEVQATCSRVIIISDGKLVADGTPDELARKTVGRQRDPRRDRRRARQRHRSARPACATSTASRTSRRITTGDWSLSDRPRADARSASSPRPAAIRAATSPASSPPPSGMDLLQLTPETASLEDVFRKLTTTQGA